MPAFDLKCPSNSSLFAFIGVIFTDESIISFKCLFVEKFLIKSKAEYKS